MHRDANIRHASILVTNMVAGNINSSRVPQFQPLALIKHWHQFLKPRAFHHPHLYPLLQSGRQVMLGFAQETNHETHLKYYVTCPHQQTPTDF